MPQCITCKKQPSALYSTWYCEGCIKKGSAYGPSKSDLVFSDNENTFDVQGDLAVKCDCGGKKLKLPHSFRCSTQQG